MRRFISVIIVAIVFLVFAMGNNIPIANVSTSSPIVEKEEAIEEAEDTDQNSALVDMVADIIEKRGKTDSTIYLIGNVIFHHNGAIIQCDSARKYSSNSMDFFGHVLINKDSAYIYGDKASYDGKTNLAEIYAPIIKSTRGDASLYTKNLVFNTKTNIGLFYDGGMIIHQDTNHMESMEGRYDYNTNEVIFRKKVSLRNPSYTAKSDSMKYNLDNGIITFLTHTTIWTKDQDILKASEGFVYTKQNFCKFSKDSYILSSSNEIWADSVEYNTKTRRATLMRKVQIVDTTHRIVGFGDWALWDDSIKYAVLTLDPSVYSYSSDRVDTMYLRGDSLIMQTGIDTTNLKRGEESENPPLPAVIKKDTTKTVPDTIVKVQDTIKEEVPAAPIFRDKTAKHKKGKKDKKRKEKEVISDSIDTVKIISKDTVPTIKKDSVKIDSIKIDTNKIDTNRIDAVIADTTIHSDDIPLDTIHIDSLMNDIRNLDTLVLRKDTAIQDTLSRIIKAYWHVKAWNIDYQFRCDSLIVHTNDSTGSMIGKPVLWTEENQLIAQQIDLYTNQGNLDWADLTGDPLIIQKVRQIHPVKDDSLRFNQATGTSMQTYFTENELDSAILSGNVHNIYWMDNKGFTAGIADITCADLTIFFKNRQLRRMRWNGNVDWKIYPLEKIDPKQERFLKDFEWLDSIRPKSQYDIISNRELRPSQREEVLSQKKPKFNIEYQLLARMKEFKKENKWEDRSDKTTVTPAYFLTH